MAKHNISTLFLRWFHSIALRILSAHPFFCVISACTSARTFRTWWVFYESWVLHRNKWLFSPKRARWPPFLNTKIQMAHGRVQYIAILRKVKNSALRYFYLNAKKKTTSLVQQGMYARRKFLNLFHNLDSCSTKIVYNTRWMSVLLNCSNVSIQAMTF